MGFFNKILPSIGIGAAKVDTQLTNATVRAGEVLDGVVCIQGGNVAQEINKIYLELMTEYVKEVDDKKIIETVVIKKFLVSEAFTIAEKEVRQIPFSITLPNITPVSIQRKSVWIQTRLDISLALDPKDRDYLEVLPHPYMQIVLDAVTQHLGFYIREVENLHHSRLGASLPFIQEFEFVPQGQFRGHLDELEMIFNVYPEGIEILMEIDKKARGLSGLFAEALDMDERKVKISLSTEQLQQGSAYISQYLYDTIKRYL